MDAKPQADFVSPLNYSAWDIAGQLTLIDIKLFSRINSWELVGGVWVGKNKKNQAINVFNLSKQFNNITYWVKQAILSNEEVEERARVVQRFINICKKLMKLKNINSMHAIYAALESTPIHRLTLTWKCVSKKRTEDLKEIQDFLDSEDNHKRMRKYLENVPLPCIPYLGVYLTDIMYMETAKRNSPEQQIGSDPVSLIKRFQQSDYDFIEHNPVLFEKLTQNLYIEELQKFRNDEDYERSVKLEPMDTKEKGSNSFSFLLGKQCSGFQSRVRSLRVKHRRCHSNFTPSELSKFEDKGNQLMIDSAVNKTINVLPNTSDFSSKLNEIFTPGTVDPYRNSMVAIESVKPVINGYLKVRVLSRKDKIIKSKYKKFFVTLKSNGELLHVNTKNSSKNFSFNIKNKDTFVMAQNTSIIVHFRQEDVKYEYKLVFDKTNTINTDYEVNMVRYWVKMMLDICTMSKTYGITDNDKSTKRFYDEYPDLMNFDK